MLSLVRKLCFAIFGITAFAGGIGGYGYAAIGFGIFAGLLFGWLCRLFLTGFLLLLNRELRQDGRQKDVGAAVERGMLFLIPFAVMAALAVYFLGWTGVAGFVSAGLMTAGGSAALEIGKLKGKQEIKNTIAASVLSYLFSALWITSAGLLSKIPPYVEGGIGLLKTFVGGRLG